MKRFLDMRRDLLARGYNSCIGPLPHRRVAQYGTAQGPVVDSGVPSHYVAIQLRPTQLPGGNWAQGLVVFECYDDSRDGAYAIAAAVAELVDRTYGRATRIYQQDRTGPTGIAWPCWVVEGEIAFSL